MYKKGTEIQKPTPYIARHNQQEKKSQVLSHSCFCERISLLERKCFATLVRQGRDSVRQGRDSVRQGRDSVKFVGFDEAEHFFLFTIGGIKGCQGRRPLSVQFHFYAVFGKNLAKQECIQVGCVPPACA